MVNLGLYDERNPAAWQHVCDISLVDAMHGLASALPELPKAWLDKKLGGPSLRSLISEAVRDTRPQKQIYNLLKPIWYKFDWPLLLQKRVVELSKRNNLGFEAFQAFRNFEWSTLVSCIAGLKPFVASHVLRTLLNGWVTSHRIRAGNCPNFVCLVAARPLIKWHITLSVIIFGHHCG